MSDLEGNLTKADGSKVLTIELIYELQGTDVSFVDLGVLFASITFPSDQELEAMLVEATVEDHFEFILWFSIDDYWIWQRCRVSSGNGINRCTKEFDHTEDWVK
jgi:hypothetical protein